MNEQRNLFHLQMAAKLKQQDTLEQYCHAWEMLTDDKTDSEILVSLERKYFLNRKQSTERLNEAQNDLTKLHNREWKRHG